MRRLRDDQGFSLVEMMVATLLFSIFTTMVATTIVSSMRAVDTTRQLTTVNEEARLALVRMSRELRQARSVDAVTLFSTGPYGAAGYANALTFSVDFNGNGTIEAASTDPEVLTYRYGPDSTGAGNGQIQLTADDASGTATVRPILSAHVSDFHFELRSSQWACDADGDGVTSWQELDTNTSANCPHPDNNGVLDANELSEIDSVVVAFTVFEGSHEQTYSSQIDLRNVGVSP